MTNYLPFSSMQRQARQAWNASLQHMRATFIFDKAALQNGIRMSVINITPIIIGAITGHLSLGIMAFLSALYVALADVGGAYRDRALAMGSAAVFMTITAFIATIVGANPWLVTLLMFVWAFGGSMLGVYGNLTSKVSFSVIGIFILLMGQPSGLADAWLRVLVFIVGSAWSLGVSLWLWPLRPFQPPRQAVGDYYLALSNLLRKVCHVQINQHWSMVVKAERTRLLEARTKVHQIVVARRTQRADANPIPQRLLMLSLQADKLVETIIALAEELRLVSEQHSSLVERPEFTQTLEACSTLLDKLAHTIIDEQQKLQDTNPEKLLVALATQEQALREALPTLLNDYQALINTRNLANLLKRMARLIREVQGTLTQTGHIELHRDANTPQEAHPHLCSWKASVHEKYTLFRANLTPHSLTFRHALRLGTISALAVAIAKFLHIPYGYWIALTILFILKPDYGSTRERGFQRMGGTVLGGILGIALTTMHNPVLLMLALAAVAFFCFAHQNGNHVLFIQFLTILVVVMIDLGTPNDWPVALIRIGNTLLGGGMGILAGYLFWPQWERERIPEQLGRTIAANRAYIASVLAAYITHGEKKGEREAVRQASMAAHLENVNAAAALQRMLSEPKTHQEDVELFYTLVSYNQRVCDSATALAVQIPSKQTQQQAEQLKRFASQIGWILRDVETATRNARPALVDPTLKESLHDVLVSLQQLTAATPEQPYPLDQRAQPEGADAANPHSGASAHIYI
ncbi:FUSC family protein [Ktedonobacter racemifer]|uniref:Uncharacterized protein n=1 Tax=Ktedonobacter racemifer DSM 44963 TaxID=485913 RepID=D6U516_KTERA|nr:FUSC family protein [Ktedonobacter racemifer]EFH81596.1 protein of unknown function DUF893 YccS/YhfK [Ktedonobacter racemifer DSM 44963]